MMVVKTNEMFLIEVGFESILQTYKIFDVLIDLSISKENTTSATTISIRMQLRISPRR